MARRSYSGNAKSTTLSGDITAAVTTFTVADGTGYPTGADGSFVVTIDAGLAAEEKVLCTSRTSNTFSGVTRGWDGTTAADHSNQAVVQHTISATDLDEANAHVNSTANAHAATAISYAGSAGLSATDVEAALDELDVEKANASAVTTAISTAVANMGKLASGSYTGNGSASRLIATPFDPKFVVCVQSASSYYSFGMAGTFGMYLDGSTTLISPGTTLAPEPTTGGFNVASGGVGHLNTSGAAVSWVAIG